MSRALRYLGFALFATLGTFVVIALVMHYINPPKKIEEAVYERIVGDLNTVDLGADPALKQSFEDSLKGRAPTAAVENPLPKKPAYTVPPREVEGFVQVEVALDATGKVTAVKVVGAFPPGIYDRQALEQVRARRYAPLTVDGRAVPGKVTEVVPFVVPSAAKPAPAKTAAGRTH